MFLGSFFADYFSLNIFFIILRETLECVIIVSVLLAYLEQQFVQNSDSAQNYNNLRLQVWTGALSGLVTCLFIGGVFILAFYLIDIDLWSKSEHYWEGVFSLLASVIISVFGVGMLQIDKLEKKWSLKVKNLVNVEAQSDNLVALDSLLTGNRSKWSQFKFAVRKLKIRFKLFFANRTMFILPFVTTLRECLESILFIGGIGLTESSSTYLLSIITGIAVGAFIGVALYKTGTSSNSAKRFMLFSTSLLYIIASGLLSKGVWQFELQKFIDLCNGLDVSEVGSGPGSYDVDNSVWHVNCCNGETDGPWMILTAIFGWTNSATYGSVSSYILYWTVMVLAFEALKYENKHGYFPLIPLKWQLKRIKKNYILKVKLSQERAELSARNSAEVQEQL